MKEKPMYIHRKQWEFAYIAQALAERGMLAPGRRGLGFAVGQEPLPSLFASMGCEIVATDLDTEEARQKGWVHTDQHAASLDILNDHGICDTEVFANNVSFRFLDMRYLPDDLGKFDFIWSSCSLEHLGSMKLGEKFIFESLKYLKPGGIAVHTTEYNFKSNFFTEKKGPSIIFRKRDIERIAGKLGRKGYHIDIDFTEGTLPGDLHVDRHPYKLDVHLKLNIGKYLATSYGLIIES